MSESEKDTERTSVRTYIPEYQKQEWKQHADDLDMTLSEFVRCMVQAGRRGFSPAPQTTEKGSSDQLVFYERQILDALEGGSMWFQDMVDLVTEDFHAQIKSMVEDMKRDGKIKQTVHGDYELGEDVRGDDDV